MGVRRVPVPHLSDAYEILHTESSCGWGGQEIRILEEAEGFGTAWARFADRHAARVTSLPEARKRGFAVRALPIARKNLAGWRALRIC